MLKRINDDPAFGKGKFEEIFEDCIKKVNKFKGGFKLNNIGSREKW